MDVAQLPFNQFLGIQRCESKDDGIFELASDQKYLNHLNTVHASALFALAEATSGQFLADQMKEEEDALFPALRRTEMKYRKPAQGAIYAKAVFQAEAWDIFLETLERRTRALMSIQVDVLDAENVLVATGTFEWFVAKAF